MRPLTFILAVACMLASLSYGPAARADCPNNPLANPGFEGDSYKTEILGTSLSSNLGVGWTPWSILGDATYNREVEYKVLDANLLQERYHIHSGNRSQKFFTTWGTHTAGFYQRVKVTPGSKVAFSIWVQIYTGERELTSGDHFISDLEWPTEEDRKRGPGVYKVWAGIDPYGDTPPGFGAPPSPHTIWSQPVTDYETRVVLPSGELIDAWVQLSVSAVAQRDYVTVYTKGQPLYPVKHNDSFWDDACLLVQAPPTATPRPTLPPTATPQSTATPLPTATPSFTPTPVPPTATPVPPTATPEPSATPLPTVTPPPPTETSAPTATPSPQPTEPPPASLAANGGTGMLLIYGGVLVVVVAALIWLSACRRS